MAVMTIAELAMLVQQIIADGNVTISNTYFDQEVDVPNAVRESEFVFTLPGDRTSDYGVGTPVYFNLNLNTIDRVQEVLYVDAEGLTYVTFPNGLIPNPITTIFRGASAAMLPLADHNTLLNVDNVNGSLDTPLHITQGQFDAISAQITNLLTAADDVDALASTVAGINNTVVDIASDVADLQVGARVPDYSASVTYAKDTLVVYDGSTYRSLVGSNLNHQPDVSGAWWQLPDNVGQALADFIATEAEAVAGTVDNKAITPATLDAVLESFSAGGGGTAGLMLNASQFISTGGYVDVRDNLDSTKRFIIQWGSAVTGNQRFETNTFPIAFPTACMRVMLFFIDGVGINGGAFLLSSIISQSQFGAYSFNLIHGLVGYIAIGH